MAEFWKQMFFINEFYGFSSADHRKRAAFYDGVCDGKGAYFIFCIFKFSKRAIPKNGFCLHNFFSKCLNAGLVDVQSCKVFFRPYNFFGTGKLQLPLDRKST